MANTQISETKIANMALSHIGHRSTIESLSEASEGAKQCDLWYHYSRIQALAVHNWSFARTRKALTTHADDPPAGVWGFRYQYPDNCLAVRHLENPAGVAVLTNQDRRALETLGDAIPFEVELNLAGNQKTILTNLQDARAIFTFDQAEANLFSPFFVEMLSHLLAHHIAFSLTSKRSIASAELAKYQSLVLAAPATDANEAVAEPPREAEVIRGRQ